MKRLITSNITSSVGMPIKKGSLDLLQEAFTDPLKSIMRSIVGGNYDPSKTYVIEGCVNSGSGSSAVISDGWILHQGSLYEFPSATFTIASGQVIVLSITDLYITSAEADPVLHTDGNSYNVHRNRIIVASSGASGSGNVNYSDVIFLNAERTAISLQNNYVIGGGFGIKAEKKRCIVTIEAWFEAHASLTCSTGVIIGTLPASMKPKESYVIAPAIYSSGSTNTLISVMVKNDGNIYLSNVGFNLALNQTNLPSGSKIIFNVTYNS